MRGEAVANTASAIVAKRVGQRGFTLVELLIVIAIVGILAAIAYPAYRDQVIKSRRSDAKIALLEMMQAANRYRTENGTYPHYDSSVATDYYPAVSPEGYYQLSGGPMTHASNTTADQNLWFRAAPVAGGLQAGDTHCAQFVLTTTGEQSYVKYATTNDDCWD